jgi:DNA-binding beta-propeller fold protein YncE
MILTLRKLWPVVLTAVSVSLLAGCNDTLRQFIIPVPKPTGDSQATANAVVLSTNPSGGNGSAVHIDVSGDTLSGIVDTGMDPVFLGKGPGRVYVINRNAAAPDTSTGSDTLTSYTSTAPLAATPNTITMPSNALNPIAGGVGASGDFFVASPTSGTLSQVAQFSQAVTNTIPIASGSPVAVAGIAGQPKIYVVNNVTGGGVGFVTVISTTDNTIVKPSIPVGHNPVWAVMSNDGVFVFVVNQGDGTVMVIDTTFDIVLPCNGGAPRCQNGAINVGMDPTVSTSSPNFAFYESKLQRLYVANTGEQSVGVIKADAINSGTGVFPSFLASVPVSGTPVSVTALSDGSKAYAALGNCPAGTNHTNLVSPDTVTGNIASCTGSAVSVISATSLAETNKITVGSGVVSVDSASDASRVYAVSAHTGNVSIIRPSTDSVLTTFSVPQQNSACTSSCALQTPFAVRVFP